MEPANPEKPITTTTPVQINLDWCSSSYDESLHTVGVPVPTSVGLVQTASAPVVVVKQPQPTKSYSGQTSYKKYKEYFTRLAQCNGWTTGVEKAQNLLVAMEGAAAEAVHGLTANKESDHEAIWEALSRRFGHMDEPERAIQLFDVTKQGELEGIALFEQNLRNLYREAWPDSDMKSKDADSLLQRRFI